MEIKVGHCGYDMKIWGALDVQVKLAGGPWTQKSVYFELRDRDVTQYLGAEELRQCVVSSWEEWYATDSYQRLLQEVPGWEDVVTHQQFDDPDNLDDFIPAIWHRCSVHNATTHK